MAQDQSPQNKTKGPPTWVLQVLAFLAWIVTALLGLVEIYLARQTAVVIFGLFSNELPTATLIGNIVVIVFAIAWLAYVIIAGETALRNVESRKSWNLFAWAFAIELLVLILSVVT